MRQLAWLYAVPQLPPKVKEALERSGQKVSANSVSRFDEMKASKILPPMPPNPMPHFILWFTELGIAGSGMGPAPLTWIEIEAWQRSVRIGLSPWEARLMRSLSVAYLDQKGKSELTTDPAPWSTPVTIAARSADEAALDAMFG